MAAGFVPFGGSGSGCGMTGLTSPEGVVFLRNMIDCCAICQTFDVAKYTTTPAGMVREMNPKKIGKILPIIWACWFTAPSAA